MSGADGSTRQARRRRWVFGVASALVLTVLAGLIVIFDPASRDDPGDDSARTTFVLCGQDFELREGYVGRYRVRARGQDENAGFYVFPTDEAPRDTLADVVTPSEVLDGQRDGRSLAAAIAQSRESNGAVISFAENDVDGCRFSAAVTDAFVDDNGRLRWYLYVYGAPR